MSPRSYSSDTPPSPDELSGLIFRIFRANGRLLTAGDDLVASLGLTSARWQVLGAIAASEPRPVVQLARDIGVSRQAVQRIANALAQEGVVEFRPNPMHKRAQLVVMTGTGRELFEQALGLQRPWAERLAAGLCRSEIGAACGALDRFLDRLETLSTSSSEAPGPDDR